jgi:hypothetical protein
LTIVRYSIAFRATARTLWHYAVAPERAEQNRTENRKQQQETNRTAKIR